MEIIVFDTEYLTDKGALSRCWSGIFDPPPLLVELGAYKVDIDKNFLIIDEMSCLVSPKDYEGSAFEISEYFEDLTGIKKDEINKKGRDFKEVMFEFQEFSNECNLYSYGNDFFRPIIQSCFYADIKCPIHISRAKDIRHILFKSGMNENEIYKNSSGSLVGYFGISFENKYNHIHDARFDALSIIETLRFLHKNARLDLDLFKE